jgi:hypothetical protein
MALGIEDHAWSVAELFIDYGTTGLTTTSAN